MAKPFKLIDLTHMLTEDTPFWDEGCGFTHDIACKFEDCEGTSVQFKTHNVNMPEGIGTHMDAPAHCFDGGKTIDQLYLDDLAAKCRVIDISDRAEERYLLSVEDINQNEAKFGKIETGDFVMVRTGWERHWEHKEKYHNKHIFPSVSEAAAEYLLENGVGGLGIDTLSPDCGDSEFPVHRLFLGHGKILMENVANLSSMPVMGGYVLAMPIKIGGGTEAPLRLVGMILS